MRGATLVLAIVLCACSKEDPPNQAAPDAFVEDTAEPLDAAEPLDTAPVDTSDAAPCIAPLDGGFTCVPPTPRPGKTVCTDAALDAVLVCFGSDSKACSAATAKYPECSACVKDWIEGDRIDFAACVYAIDPTNPCGTTVQCTLDCLDAVCSACDPTVGSGSMPARSARDDCERAASSSGDGGPVGACWDVAAKDYAACATDPRFMLCFPRRLDELVPFFRGACRDGGDYSRVYETSPADAATD
jgi:hypothetical protein